MISFRLGQRHALYLRRKLRLLGEQNHCGFEPGRIFVAVDEFSPEFGTNRIRWVAETFAMFDRNVGDLLILASACDPRVAISDSAIEKYQMEMLCRIS